jgi:predicted nucleic-acid-binding Zn-ribbon protein
VNKVKAAKVEKHKCPKCGCKAVRRSHMRGFWEGSVLRALGVKAYRCDGCDHRYYEFKGIEVQSGKLEG